MATNPSFIATPVIGAVSASVANTNIDGTGTITTLVTGAATGTRVLEITAQCSTTSAAARVNIFLSIDSGTTWRLFDQLAITAATPNTTTSAARTTTTYSNLVLRDTTHRIGVTTSVTQGTNILAFGGEL